jgi:uncharacterized membrane protein YdbT with pleckstrin-like domain
LSHLDQNLIPGETLLYQTGRHWIVLVVPLILGVFVGLPGLAFVFSSDAAPFAFIMLIIGGASIGFAFLTRKSVEMGVTNKRVITKTGILSRKTTELLLTKVESIKVDEGLLGRMLGYGTVIVVGTGGTPEPFPCIEQPLEFRRQVQQQIETSKTPEPVGAR